jgi:hypothetical protein
MIGTVLPTTVVVALGDIAKTLGTSTRLVKLRIQEPDRPSHRLAHARYESSPEWSDRAGSSNDFLNSFNPDTISRRGIGIS